MIPKAIFFDWDGTLVDSYSFLEQGHMHVHELFGMPPLQKDVYRPWFGQPKDHVYEHFYKGKRLEAETHFRQFVFQNTACLLKPLSGAGDLLKTAKDLGIVMGVVSNKQADFIKLEIANFAWGEFLPVLVGAGEARENKPSAAPLIMAIERARIKTDMENIWYVGDTEVDMKCAKEAYCPAVFVTGGQDVPGWMANYKPFLIKENCAEITDFLLQTCGKSLKTSLPE
ncbi:MAG: HAD family hydrolase [Alphaproteobacteria bacterium]